MLLRAAALRATRPIFQRGLTTTAARMAPALKEGDRVPSVTFKARVRDPQLVAAGESNPYDWKDVSSDALFGNGRRVVVFALPGAL